MRETGVIRHAVANPLKRLFPSDEESEKYKRLIFNDAVKKSGECEDNFFADISLAEARNNLQALMKLFNYIPYTEYFSEVCADMLRNSSSERNLKLVILGEMSSGKSTFINSLLGSRLMPENVLATSALITLIDYGEEERISIQYKDGRSRETDRNGFIRLVDQQADKDAEEERSLVSEINCRFPSGFLKNLTIIDTPGFNSGLLKHDDITRNYLHNADAIFWVFDGTKAGADTEKQSIRFLEKFSSKSYAVMNKIDRVSPPPRRDPEKHRAQINKTIEYLRDNFGNYFKDIIPVSAKKALDEPPESEAYIYSNLGCIKETIEEEIAGCSEEIILKSALYKFKTILNTILMISDDFSSRFEEPLSLVKELEEAAENKTDYGEMEAFFKSVERKIYDEQNRVGYICNRLSSLLEVESRKKTVLMEDFIRKAGRMDEFRHLLTFKDFRYRFLKLCSIDFTGSLYSRTRNSSNISASSVIDEVDNEFKDRVSALRKELESITNSVESVCGILGRVIRQMMEKEAA